MIYYYVRDDHECKYVTHSKNDAETYQDELSENIDDAVELMSIGDAHEIATEILETYPTRSVSIVMYNR